MKAVVGIGSKSECLSALDLFARLGFPDSSAVLVYSVESVLPDGGFLPEAGISPIVDIQRQRQQDGARLLDEVAAEYKERGLACTTLVVFGSPAHTITEVAERDRADLLVAGSGKKGPFESFIMGSVTRALVSASQCSILVGKVAVGAGRPLNVLYATDHSSYASQCADLFVRLAPTGIGKITVVTADTLDADVREAIDNAEGISRSEVLSRKNDALKKSLQSVGRDIDCHVIAGSANNAIDEAMKLTRADLLVIGAHGHGFLERMVMGSTAMHMVGNAPWNVLVLRV